MKDDMQKFAEGIFKPLKEPIDKLAEAAEENLKAALDAGAYQEKRQEKVRIAGGAMLQAIDQIKCPRRFPIGELMVEKRKELLRKFFTEGLKLIEMSAPDLSQGGEIAKLVRVAEMGGVRKIRNDFTDQVSKWRNDDRMKEAKKIIDPVKANAPQTNSHAR